MEGFSGPETAEIPGISENSANVRLHRARQKLQQQLENLIDTWKMDTLAIGLGALVLSVQIATPVPDYEFLAFYVMVTIGVSGATYWLNRRIAKNQLQPREQAIRKLISELG